jgi:hypothetical protein
VYHGLLFVNECRIDVKVSVSLRQRGTFVFIEGHVLPLRGQNMTHKGLKPIDKRKSY